MDSTERVSRIKVEGRSREEMNGQGKKFIYRRMHFNQTYCGVSAFFYNHIPLFRVCM